jgi:hypothetical protein
MKKITTTIVDDQSDRVDKTLCDIFSMGSFLIFFVGGLFGIMENVTNTSLGTAIISAAIVFGFLTAIPAAYYYGKKMAKTKTTIETKEEKRRR